MLNKISILKAQRARLLGSSYSEIASDIFGVSDRHERRIRKVGQDQGRESLTLERKYWIKMQIADCAIRDGIVDQKVEEVNNDINFWVDIERYRSDSNKEMLVRLNKYRDMLNDPDIDQDKLKTLINMIERCLDWRKKR